MIYLAGTKLSAVRVFRCGNKRSYRSGAVVADAANALQIGNRGPRDHKLRVWVMLYLRVPVMYEFDVVSQCSTRTVQLVRASAPLVAIFTTI